MFDKIDRLPFDWTNSIEYPIAVALQVIFALEPFRYVECFLTYGFAGLLLAFSIVEDIKIDLNRFNAFTTSKHRATHATKKLSKLIQFDIDLRVYAKSLKFKRLEIIIGQKINLKVYFFRLPGYIVEIYSTTLLALFIGCTAAICLALLMIQVDFIQVFTQYISAQDHTFIIPLSFSDTQ